MNIDKEMMKALEADGEKLRQLTGEDHGPQFSLHDALEVAVVHHTLLGGRRVDDMLGIQQMPIGYALLIDADEIYFHWLRYDGLEGPDSTSMWASYRGAKWNYDNALAVVTTPALSSHQGNCK